MLSVRRAPRARFAGSHPTARPASFDARSEEFADLLRLNRSIVAALMLLVCWGTVAATAQSISFPSPATVISQNGVNLRSLASTSSPSVSVVPFGTVVTIAGLPTADGWYPILWGSNYGWTMGDYLAAGSLDPTTAATAPSLSAAHVSVSAALTTSARATGPLLPPPAPPAAPAGGAASGGPPSPPAPLFAQTGSGASTGGPPPPPAALSSTAAGSSSQPGPAGGPPPLPASFATVAAGLAPSTSPYQATATYYGVDDSFQAGQAMACGAPFDPGNAHSAATNDWPCGTKLHVSNASGKSIDVTVADHGAYPQHWIDLTYAGFGQLADHSTGEIIVTVQLSQ